MSAVSDSSTHRALGSEEETRAGCEIINLLLDELLNAAV